VVFTYFCSIFLKLKKMRTKKTPLSIRLFYTFSTIALILLGIVLLITLVFNILLYTDFFGNDMQLHTKLPIKVELIEAGSLHLNNQKIKVELVEATTKIHFINTPMFIANKMGIAMLIAVLIIGYLTWIFSKFIANVQRGIVFTIANITLLKKLAYGLVGFWFFTLIYSQFFYFYIAKHLEFENVKIGGNEVSIPSNILIAALGLWVLAHIFIKGLQLQQEKDLTI